MRVCKILFIGIIILSFSAVQSFSAGKPAGTLDSNNIKDDSELLSFAEDRIIIKFKEDPECVDCLIPGKASGKSASSKMKSIKELNKKFKVKEMHQLLGSHRTTGKRITQAEERKRQDAVKEKLRTKGRKFPDKKLPEMSKIYLLVIEEGADVTSIIRSYHDDPNVEYVQPDYLIKKNIFADNTQFSMQGFEMIKANYAWSTTQGEGMIVAVIDTGVDYTHQDLIGNIWTNSLETINSVDDDGNGYVDDIRGWDSAYWDADPMDENGHGTHVAGIIAATGNVRQSFKGVAPQSKIMIVKGLRDEGYGYTSRLASSIHYAADNGADIINNSWANTGRYSEDPVIEDAVRYAHGLGAVVIFGAGNHNDDAKYYSPQNMKETITVSASYDGFSKVSWSNYGSMIDVAAPGYAESLYLSNEYKVLVGTSMAAPHVSGLAALILAHRPEFTNEDVRQAIRFSADDLNNDGFDKITGHGFINALSGIQVDSVLYASITEPVSPTYYADLLIESSFAIKGSAFGESFSGFTLDYKSENSSEWLSVQPQSSTSIESDTLGNLDVSLLEADLMYDVRLQARTHDGRVFEDHGYFKTWAGNPYVTKITTDKNQIVDRSDYTTNRYEATGIVDISENYIVWQERTGTGIDFFSYDLNTAEEKRLTFEDLYTPFSFVVSGDYLAWSSLGDPTRIGNDSYEPLNEVKLMHIPTNQIQVITPDSKVPKRYTTSFRAQTGQEGFFSYWVTDMDGDNLIFESNAGNETNYSKNVYHYSISAGIQKNISNSTNDQFRSRTSDNKVIWLEYNRSTGVGHEIFMYDIINKSLEKLNAFETKQSYRLGISKGTIVSWEDYDFINYYDITTKVRHQVTSSLDESFDVYLPEISGDRIVWGKRTGYPIKSQIMMYDIRTRMEHQITHYPDARGIKKPKIEGNRIVWRETRNGKDGIYMYEIPPYSTLTLEFIGDKGVQGDEYLSFTVRVVDANQYDSLIFSIKGLPQGANFDASTQEFSWTPSPEQGGIYPLRFEVTDGVDIDFEEMSIGVVKGQNPPVLGPIGDKAVIKDQLLHFNVTASEPDGDSLKFSASNLPQGATFDSVTGEFSWVAAIINGKTSYAVTFMVSDGQFIDYENIVITFGEIPNRPPVLDPIGDKAAFEGEILTFTVTASDPNGDKLEFHAINLPVGATFNSVTREFSWIAEIIKGKYARDTWLPTFRVSDREFLVQERISITVLEPTTDEGGGGGGGSKGGGKKK